MTNERNATANTDLLRSVILEELYQNNMEKMKQSIGKVERSYNQTQGVIIDILEAIGQKVSSTFDGNKTDEEVKKLRDKLRKEMSRSKQSEDLTDQVNAYMASIKNGNSVLVVAHSQGNLFTYQTYNLLDNWMKPYFEAISVASPTSKDIRKNTPKISWDNDLVAHLGFYGGLITNEVRKVWLSKFNTEKMKQESKKSEAGQSFTFVLN